MRFFIIPTWQRQWSSLLPAGLVTGALFLNACASMKGQEPLGTSLTASQLFGPKKNLDAQKDPATEIEVSIYPCTSEVPLHPLRFWPLSTEVKPGSASLHIARVFYFFETGKKNLSPEDQQLLFEKDLSELDRTPDQLAKNLRLTATFELMCKELDAIAYAEEQFFDHRIRELKGAEVYGYLLPDVQEIRSIGRVLTFVARTHLDNKNFVEMAKSIKSGYRLADLLKSSETLISYLVGTAIESQLDQVVFQAIQRPDTPQLYWAIRSVPHSPEKLKRVLEIEQMLMLRSIPAIDDPINVGSDSEYWEERWRKTAETLKLLGVENANANLTLIAAGIAGISQQDRDELIRDGVEKAAVNRMPNAQVLAVKVRHNILRTLNQWHRVSMLSPADALIASTELNAKLRQHNNYSVDEMIMGLLLPSYDNVFYADARLIALRNRLLIIDALRLYGAEHDCLPESLDKITPTLPLNPLTNKPYEYVRINEQTAMLVTSPHPLRPNDANIKPIRIEFKKQ